MPENASTDLKIQHEYLIRCEGRCHLLMLCSFGLLAYFSLQNSRLVSKHPSSFSHWVLNKSFPTPVSYVSLLSPFLSSFIFLTPVRPSSGSPAELCQLCVDDEIVAVNGVLVAHMSYSQWKDKMTSSLQTGSLTMDIRRYGNKGEIRIRNKKRLMSFSPHLEVIGNILTTNFRPDRRWLTERP